MDGLDVSLQRVALPERSIAVRALVPFVLPNPVEYGATARKE